MITITNIHKLFNRGKANQVNAVNGLDLVIHDEEFVVRGPCGFRREPREDVHGDWPVAARPGDGGVATSPSPPDSRP